MKHGLLVFCVAFALGAEAADKQPGTLGLGYTVHSSDEGKIRQWLLVRGVQPGGAAERAGVAAQDLIVAIAGKPLAYRDDVELLDFFGSIRAGDKVEMTLMRGDERRTVTLVATEMTAEQRQRWQQNYELAKKERERRKKH